MPPRRANTAAAAGARAAQDAAAAGDDAGPSDRVPEYVAFTLIQAIMAEGYKQEQEVKSMVRRLLNKNDDGSYMAVLSKMQRDLQWLELTIERIKLPVNDEWYLCTVNKEPDQASMEMGSDFSIQERAYFDAVIDKIGSQPPEGGALIASVGGMTLKNVLPKPAATTAAAAGGAGGEPASQAAGGAQAAAGASGQSTKAKPMSLLEREEALNKLARQGWLYMPKDGHYTLGPRTLLELKDRVMSTLPAEAAERLSSDYM
ncbi:hypothetical protein HYH02_006939 [Chlamydomonas schloesseri]|uniref:Non-structural maintenance of chromosomes element 1 homolog n=1 Tax=Chlamydomonas schloesseri TaxID=2026947 RepID=A0A836B5Q2_9CHLO|nr:hypothetical protein HYH02_006939 [Chlamydomonas schloesseri]|eukprot:KAG2448357.1 hypothetical protein HYH02_006939 [Chlamydomonas schloesseri]